MRFVVRLEEGERMTDLCREFGISRKTGYKLLQRYKQWGAVGLFDLSRRAEHLRHRLAPEIAAVLVATRKEHPTWGPRKLRAWLAAKHPELKQPAASTIGGLLQRRGLVQPHRRRRVTPPHGSPLQVAGAPNEVWCADFKGQFRLGNGRYCYPLTITDRFSRIILACEALERPVTEPVQAVFELVFRQHGLPQVIRTDNGAPFASTGLAGLSRLSVWWRRLGIVPERIAPAHPEQNGQHERMHLVLKQETTRPAAPTLLQQQERFDRFVEIYNCERPHEALGQEPPMRHYRPSPRTYPERLPEAAYSLHDDIVTVSHSGHLHLRHGPTVFLSSALDGQRVGVREVGYGRWLVSFLDHDLGHVDTQTGRFAPIGRDRPAMEERANSAESCPPATNSSEVSPMLPAVGVKVVVAWSHQAASRRAGSGFSTTSSTGVQLRVSRDQRSGFRRRACS
jgi:transposase InsO family protein